MGGAARRALRAGRLARLVRRNERVQCGILLVGHLDAVVELRVGVVVGRLQRRRIRRRRRWRWWRRGRLTDPATALRRGPGSPDGPAQYQLVACELPHAEHGDPYVAAMYSSPQMIWVRALDAQSSATVAILSPGSACAMPVAPLDGFMAR